MRDGLAVLVGLLIGAVVLVLVLVIGPRLVRFFEARDFDGSDSVRPGM